MKTSHILDLKAAIIATVILAIYLTFAKSIKYFIATLIWCIVYIFVMSYNIVYTCERHILPVTEKVVEKELEEIIHSDGNSKKTGIIKCFWKQ
jgi:uncharacterized membrane protein